MLIIINDIVNNYNLHILKHYFLFWLAYFIKIRGKQNKQNNVLELYDNINVASKNSVIKYLNKMAVHDV